MRHLPVPNVNDVAILEGIVARSPLSECPHLQADLALIRGRYAAYVAVQGNPIDAGAPQPIAMPGQLQAALGRRYDSPNEALAHIAEIRSNGSPNVCPMCGCPVGGTVDHVFPQNPFSEFAIFSPNLVPACPKCNTGRQNRYKGNAPGERVLHPYFDTRLRDRLLQVRLIPSIGGFRAPNMELEVLLPENDPLYPAASYHMTNVVLRSGILDWLRGRWATFQRKPDVFFRELPAGAFTDEDLLAAIEIALELADEEFSTPNNWQSMLLAGLQSNQNAITALAGTIRDIRSGALDPRDI